VKLQPDKQPSLNTVSAYGQDYIEINAQRYTSSVFLSPESPVIEWSCTRFEDIKTEDFEQIAKLGSGERIRFPQPALIAPLIARNIGLETMDLQAACRTYNVLMAEGRKVVAALLIEK
jgi:uncharacterized protein